MKSFKLLLKFMKGNILLFLAAIAAMNLSTLFATMSPLIIRATIDSVIGDKPFELPGRIVSIIGQIGGKHALLSNLWISCVALVVITLGQGVFQFLKGKLAALSAQNSGKKLRDYVYDHLQHLPYDFHVKSKAGDLIQRCTSDVETAQNFVANQSVEIGQTIISFCYVFIIMLILDVKYTLVSISLIPVILLFTFKFFVSMKKIFKAADEADGRMSTTLQENLTGVRVVKAFGAQSFEIGKYDEKNRDYRDRVYLIIKLMANFWSLSDFLCMLQFMIVLVTGVYWASSGRISIGTLVAFISYAGMLIWPIRHLGQILAFMSQAFVSLGRIQEILDRPTEFRTVAIKQSSDGQYSALSRFIPRGSLQNKLTEEHNAAEELKPQMEGGIEFRNVSFEYEEGNPVLDNVSFHVGKGQTMAILGPTGSGKSSLVHLLVRLYEYHRGSIRLDGIELKHIDKKWLRQNVGIVLQEPFLFSKSIEENIRYGRNSASSSEIFSSASTASVHETIEGFENGYGTVVGERGVTLSGGQRQRLAIARTVIRNSPILIFDDSLSAVDMETDARIRRALKERCSETTTIIISHRITTLSGADLILVLEEGKITQSGTHSQLIKQDGLYRRVWEIQNSLEEELYELH